jgi:hypothetical protein
VLGAATLHVAAIRALRTIAPRFIGAVVLVVLIVVVVVLVLVVIVRRRSRELVVGIVGCAPCALRIGIHAGQDICVAHRLGDRKAGGCGVDADREREQHDEDQPEQPGQARTGSVA